MTDKKPKKIGPNDAIKLSMSFDKAMGIMFGPNLKRKPKKKRKK